MDVFSLGNWVDPKDRQSKHTIFGSLMKIGKTHWLCCQCEFFCTRKKAKKARLIEKQALQDQS